MSPKAKVLDLWPNARCSYAEVGRIPCKKVEITKGRIAYGKTPAAAWREAWSMVTCSNELRKGDPAAKPSSPLTPKGGA